MEGVGLFRAPVVTYLTVLLPQSLVG